MSAVKEQAPIQHCAICEDPSFTWRECVIAALSSRDAEIREVLEGLATYRNPICWCPPNAEAEPHTEACRATTVLYAKLQPGKEGKDSLILE